MRPDEIIFTITVATLVTCLVIMFICFIRIAHINKKKYDAEREKYIVDIRSIPVANIITINPISRETNLDHSPV